MLSGIAFCSASTAKGEQHCYVRLWHLAEVFIPVLDDIYELTTSAPTPIDVTHRRRLAPEAVVALDWHNDMSKLILDINDRIDAAADDRAHGVIVRKLHLMLISISLCLLSELRGSQKRTYLRFRKPLLR
jgi:hypothetical protein